MTVNEYDDAGRLVNLTHTASDDTLLSSYSYELDGVGNCIQAVETLTETTRTITNVYDPLNRLTSADYSTGEQFEYAYDAVGNRTAMTATQGVASTTGVHTYTYDEANRLTSVDGVTYTWDARGNLTHDGTFTYTYNSAGRMVGAESLTVTLVYTYNAAGLRVAQSVDGGETTFAWDWASGLPEMLSEGQAMGSSIALYLLGHDTLGRWDGATWAYYLPDALGSVRQVADGAGAVVSAREWSPYGVEIGAAHVGLGYTGEWWDSYAQIQYTRARWYQPRVGRFTRRDPVRLEANPYLYAGGDPINRVDPSGLLSNATIAASLGMESFEDVLDLFEGYQNWALLKLLQDADVGDRIYSGTFNWTAYAGTIECYSGNRSAPFVYTGCSLPREGGIVLGGERRKLVLGDFLVVGGVPYDNWYYLNNNYGLPAYTNKTDFGVLPDYVVASGGLPLAKLVGVVGVGWNINVAVDRYGNIYGGGALDVGVGLPLSGGIAMGWLNQNGLTGDSWIPKQAELQGFIGGLGGGVAGYAVIGGGIAYNYDFPRGLFSEAIAGEVGIAIPTVGWSFLEGMFWVTRVSWLEWDWVDRYPMQHGYGRQDIRMVDDRPVDCGC